HRRLPDRDAHRRRPRPGGERGGGGRAAQALRDPDLGPEGLLQRRRDAGPAGGGRRGVGQGTATKSSRKDRASAVSRREEPPAPPQNWLAPKLVSPTRNPSWNAGPPESPKHEPPPARESASFSASFNTCVDTICPTAVVKRRVRSLTAVGFCGPP